MFFILKQQIELLRKQMIYTASTKGNLLDPEVLALSQQLDHLLVKAQRIHMRQQSYS